MAVLTGARSTGDPDPFGYGGGGPEGGASTSTQDTRSSTKPLGVPKGYVAERPKMWTPSPGRSGRVDYGALHYTQKTPAKYFDGDQYRLRNLSPAEIWELQQIMADAGLYNAGAEINQKIWDEDTADAYAKVLAYANQQGLTDKQALMELAGARGSAQGIRYEIDENGNLVQVAGPGTQPQDTRQPLVTRTTDPDALRLVFKEASMNMLGVAAGPQEIDRMIKAYNQMEVSRQQQAYDKELTGGSVLDIISPEAYGQADILKRHAPAAQEYSALEHVTDALSFLASPAWGVGG